MLFALWDQSYQSQWSGLENMGLVGNPPHEWLILRLILLQTLAGAGDRHTYALWHTAKNLRISPQIQDR